MIRLNWLCWEFRISLECGVSVANSSIRYINNWRVLVKFSAPSKETSLLQVNERLISNLMARSVQYSLKSARSNLIISLRMPKHGKLQEHNTHWIPCPSMLFPSNYTAPFLNRIHHPANRTFVEVAAWPVATTTLEQVNQSYSVHSNSIYMSSRRCFFFFSSWY